MKTAKLFKNGNSQAVRLPKEFRFEGDEVYIKRVGSGVVLFEKENPWSPLLQAIGNFPDDVFPDGRGDQGKHERDMVL